MSDTLVIERQAGPTEFMSSRADSVELTIEGMTCASVVAGAAMAFSSVSVVSNALLLRRWRPAASPVLRPAGQTERREPSRPAVPVGAGP